MMNSIKDIEALYKEGLYIFMEWVWRRISPRP